MSKSLATSHQLEALRAAAPSGSLRYLSGGFWVQGDYPQVERGHVPARSLSTHTIKACARRGWFAMESWHRAHLTEAGRTVIAAMADVVTDLFDDDRLAS